MDEGAGVPVSASTVPLKVPALLCGSRRRRSRRTVGGGTGLLVAGSGRCLRLLRGSHGGLSAVQEGAVVARSARARALEELADPPRGRWLVPAAAVAATAGPVAAGRGRRQRMLVGTVQTESAFARLRVELADSVLSVPVASVTISSVTSVPVPASLSVVVSVVPLTIPAPWGAWTRAAHISPSGAAAAHVAADMVLVFSCCLFDEG
jgi:hypothetical protein